MELIDGLAFLNFRAIRTGIIVPADATDLDPAFGLAEIALFIFISELTSLAHLLLQCLACSTIRATAAYLHCRHVFNHLDSATYT